MSLVPMNQTDFTNYVSPFSWRYGSEEMRRIFSEVHKYDIWRKIWVALAKVQKTAGLVKKAELDDLVKHQHVIDIGRILEIEKETKHDVVAGIREFAEKAKIGGGKIHLGATSMDIYENTEIIRMQEGLILVDKTVRLVLRSLSTQILRYASLPCMGYTHLQPAEPTTVGYRLATYAQDLLIDLEFISFVRQTVKAKGMKGPVGTRGSFAEVLGGRGLSARDFDQRVMNILGVEALEITNQVYPRKYDFLVLSALSAIAASLAKLAGDIRILQMPAIGEWSEPFGKKQVGSSAMPFKKNPIDSEKICSLARYVVQLSPVGIQNAILSYLERTLDDSANRRIIIPEAFLATDEILSTAQKIISGLVVNKEKIARNLSHYAPFAAIEKVIIRAVQKGANRQEMHEHLREISMEAWADIQNGKPNPMHSRLVSDGLLGTYLKPKDIETLLDVSDHIGDASERAVALAKKIDMMNILT